MLVYLYNFPWKNLMQDQDVFSSGERSHYRNLSACVRQFEASCCLYLNKSNEVEMLTAAYFCGSGCF